MNRHIVAFLLLLGSLTLAKADSYNKLWKQVEHFQQKDLPKSAIPLVDSIIHLSQMKNDGGHLLKALLVRRQLAGDISPDSAKRFIPLLEKRLSEEKDLAAQALFHCVLGHLWANSGDDTEKSPLAESMRHYQLSFEHPGELMQAKAAKYIPLIIQGQDESIFHGDLMNVVARYSAQGLKNLEYRLGRPADSLAKQILHTAIQAYQKADNRRAEVLTMIDSADICPSHMGKSKNFYSMLIQQHKDLDVGVEAYIRLASQSQPRDAYPLLNEGIRRYPKSKRTNELRNQLSAITQPHMSLCLKDTFIYPGCTDSITIRTRNMKKAVLRFYISHLNERPYRMDTVKLGRPVLEIPIDMPSGEPYEEIKKQIAFQLPQADHYFVRLEGDGIKSETEFLQVSRLHLMQLPLMNDKVCVVVNDALTGKPIQGATLRLRQVKDSRLLQTMTTDHEGKAVVVLPAPHTSVKLFASADKDKGVSALLRTSPHHYFHVEREQKDLALYTDRAIYRPGQKVQVGGFLYRKFKDETGILGQENVELRLLDANRKEIAKQFVTTDELGSLGMTFQLPEHCLNGRFMIDGGNGSVTFRVEEYKRPTFQVLFNDVDTAYKAGDTVSVSGNVKTYAGIPLNATRVALNIHRQKSYWWRLWEDNLPDSFKDIQDTVVTDDEGNFRVAVPLSIPSQQGASAFHPRFYTYVIHATITADNGETEENETHLSVGNTSVAIHANLPSVICREHPQPFTVTQQNANGQRVEGTAHYAILKDGTEMEHGEWAFNQARSTQVFHHLPSGQYTLHILPGGQHDSLALFSCPFAVFSLSDSKPFSPQPLMVYSTAGEIQPNDTAQVLVSTCLGDGWLYYDVFDNKKHRQSRLIPVSDTLMAFRFPSTIFQEDETIDGLQVLFAMVRNGEVHKQSVYLTRPRPDKHLTLRWQTFRDRLQPGRQETWTMQVLRDGQPVQASLIATLYDASLDKFEPLNWFFRLDFPRQLPHAYWYHERNRALCLSMAEQLKFHTVSGWSYSHLDETLLHPFSFRVPNHRLARSKGALMMAKQANTVVTTDFAMAAAPTLEEKVMDTMADAGPEGAPATQSEASVRSDFSETAYFQPRLTTNDKGEAQFSFVLPESLTQWNFKALAHDKEMNHAMADTAALAQKDFMIQPNMPRFLRSGDATQVAVTIRNNKEVPVSGKALLELSDPATFRVIHRQQQDFHVSGGRHATVFFSITATGQYPMLICRMTAGNKDFSDGEQHYLPILSQRQSITESIPLTVQGGSQEHIRVDTLFSRNHPQALDRSLTIEYTANPAWTAIESLPTLTQVRHNNAHELSQGLYALSIAAWHAQSHPEIYHLAQQWKHQGSPDSTFMILQRNQTLKQVLLQETPWVIQADAAQERLQGLAQLFDSLTLSFRLTSFADRLLDLQGPSGGWSWFPGMPANTWTTLCVAETLARLQSTLPTQLSPSLQLALQRATAYLDTQAQETVKHLKENEKKKRQPLTVGTAQLRYLYIVALQGWHDTPTRTYLLKHIQQEAPQYDMQDKAMAARILALAHRTTAARDILESLMQHTVATPTMGRYFDTDRAPSHYDTYRIPTQVAALEALRETAPGDTLTLQQMTQWLIQSKRTQMWNQASSAVDAIYWMTRQGTSYRASDHMAMPRTTLRYATGREKEFFPSADCTQAAATLGYMQHHLDSTLLHRLQGIDIRSGKNAPLAFGAVYAQYTLPLADISANASGLKLQVQYKRAGDSQWQSAASLPTLHLGEVITFRYLITADRDYDFVHLHAPRAACCEPTRPLSGYNGMYYRETGDTSLQYFFQHLSKGTHIVEESLRTDRTGRFTTGAPTLQCIYAPEFSARATASSLTVEP